MCAQIMLREMRNHGSDESFLQPEIATPRPRPVNARVLVPLPVSHLQRNESLQSKAYLRAIESIRSRPYYGLRLSLSAVFFWFGFLKLINLSPVTAILRQSLPLLAHAPFLELLGLAEITIAIGLIIERWSRPAVLMMLAHLVCTFSLLIVAPHLIFAPFFPMLTMEGEFVFKNVVFIAAGLALIFQSPPKKPALAN